ncbi:MAG: hypothetical protein H6873_11735 [Hyphomicrobiaceae bacterium]|nr:hypothetical protein [Hyphomicrobiaceae bacterium]
MANILVTSNFSLEQAIAKANSTAGNDTIRFDPSLAGQTLYLSHTLQISQGVVTIDGDIDGDFNIDIKVSGDQGVIGDFSDDLAVLIEVDGGARLNLRNIEFRDAYGRGADGHYDGGNALEAESARAGIFNAGALYVTNSVFTDFYARGGDGYAFPAAHYAESGAGSAEAGIINSGTLNLYQVAIEDMKAVAGSKAYVPGGNDGGSAITGLIQDAGTTYVTQSLIKSSIVRASGAQDGGALPGGNGAFAFSAGINRVNDASSMTGAISQFGGNVLASPFPGVGSPAGQYGSSGDFFGDNSLQSWGNRSSSGDDSFTWTLLPALGEHLYGLQGDDIIIDGAGSAHLFGGSGNDQLTIYGLDPAAYGQTGNDSIFAQGFYAGHVATLDGGVGIDILDLHLISGQALKVDLRAGSIVDGGNAILATAAGFESLVGTDDATVADVLLGTDGNNSLQGLAGNDVLNGRGGNDRIWGGDDRDSLNGGNGADILNGGADRDRLIGGRGNDRLRGNDGNDNINGGSGNDQIAGGANNDTIATGSGFDRLIFGKNDGNDLVTDYDDLRDLFDFRAFHFRNKAAALSHFYEIGGKNNDVVGFHANGTDIKIKGADLKDIGASDVIV